MFLECFKEAYGGLKCIDILPKKVCFVFVVGQSSQLPEQKEGLFYSNIYVLCMLVFGNI